MTNENSNLNHGKEMNSGEELSSDNRNEDIEEYSLEDLTDISQSKQQDTRPLQFRIPYDIFADFSERAGREFGFTHGAKKQLFLKIWDEYKKNKIN